MVIGPRYKIDMIDSNEKNRSAKEELTNLFLKN